MWVLGGYGGEGDPVKQNAGYILVYDSNNGNESIKRVEEYYKHLVDSGVSGAFGTPFGWTYPSKRKGKDIQLKLKLIE